MCQIGSLYRDMLTERTARYWFTCITSSDSLARLMFHSDKNRLTTEGHHRVDKPRGSSNSLHGLMSGQIGDTSWHYSLSNQGLGHKWGE